MKKTLYGSFIVLCLAFFAVAGTLNAYPNNATFVIEGNYIGKTPMVGSGGFTVDAPPANINSNLLPTLDNTYNVGSTANSWHDIYADGTIYGTLSGSWSPSASSTFLYGLNILKDCFAAGNGTATTTICGGGTTSTFSTGFTAGQSDFTGNVTGININEIENPVSDVSFNFGNNKTLTFVSNDTTPVEGEGIFNFQTSGAFTGNMLHVHQHTGNPGTSVLLWLESTDADVTPMYVLSNGKAAIYQTNILIGNGLATSTLSSTATSTFVKGLSANMVDAFDGFYVGRTATSSIYGHTTSTLAGGIDSLGDIAYKGTNVSSTYTIPLTFPYGATTSTPSLKTVLNPKTCKRIVSIKGFVTSTAVYGSPAVIDVNYASADGGKTVATTTLFTDQNFRLELGSGVFVTSSMPSIGTIPGDYAVWAELDQSGGHAGAISVYINCTQNNY